MDKWVRFYGSKDTEFVELRTTAQGEDGVALSVRFEVDGAERWQQQISATRAELQALAKWLDDFWNECPPAKLGDGRLQFVYSHREHIGEGYYQLEMDGRHVITAYEQLGTSNTFRAEKVRELAG